MPAAAGGTDPIRVTIASVTPSSLDDDSADSTDSADETVTVTGTVTNASDSTWTEVHVYPLTSYQPFTTAAALAEALKSPASTYIGQRLLDLRDVLPGTLEPGRSASFTLSLPRSQLKISGAPGVYWLGLNILGTEDGARESDVDGRARILLPLMDSATSTPLSLVMSVRDRWPRDSKGRVIDAGVATRELDPDGRLGRLLSVSEQAGTIPLAWLVDPQVLDAAAMLATGNKALNLAAKPTQPKGSAADWLTRFDTGAVGREVLSVPYGDLDVTAAYRAGRSELVGIAQQESAAILTEHGITAASVVAPTSGRLSWQAAAGLGAETPALLDPSAIRGSDVPLRLDTSTGTELLTTTTLADGDAVSTRQSVLAQAAVHALSDDATQPLVVQLPSYWDPGADSASFFSGLAAPWVRPVPVSTALDAPAAVVTDQASHTLREPSTKDDLPAGVFSEAGRLIHTGRVLSELVSGDDTIATTTTRWALVGTSTQARSAPASAEQTLAAQTGVLNELLARVHIKIPTFVTMSSEEGPFQITVQNDLPVAVEVGVQTEALGGKLTVDQADPIQVGADQRRSVRLVASARGVGEYRLRLRAETTAGTAFGTTTELRIRSSRVGQFIWLGLGGGTLVLVGLIAIRIRRKVVARKRAHGPLLKGAEVL